MKRKHLGVLLLGVVVVFVVFLINNTVNPNQPTSENKVATVSTQAVDPSNPSVQDPNQKLKILKDVGEAYMDNFGLTEADFANFQKANVTTLEGNFDICATDVDVRYFLNQSQKYNLKVIMPAGSGEAEWGYVCDSETYSATQKPHWQKEKVTAWVNKWKSHPAIYGWDTSNEAGSVFPNGDKGFYLTVEQLQEAYQTVKAADPSRPVMIRQNGWFYYENPKNPFIAGNPFSTGVADVAMVNAYSNVEDYYSDFVKTVTSRAFSFMQNVDPNVKVTVSVGVWEEKPLWFKPTVDQTKQDLNALETFQDLLGVAYFKYGAKGSEWYLPESAPELWELVKSTRF